MAEPEVEAPPEPRRVHRTRLVRLVAWIVVLVAVVVVAVVVVVDVGPPSEAELRRQAVGGKSELLIGVKDDTPGVSLRDPATGEYTGFDIDIAYLVAGDLGFRPDQVRFLSIETEDRSRMQARGVDGRFVTVDLVVASFSMTKERAEQPGVRFAGPYLSTQQSVVTLTGHKGVSSLEDLRGEKVCTLATSTSSNAAKAAGVTFSGKNEISDCVAGLKAGEFDAVTTDAAILAGFVADDQGKTLVHHDVGLVDDELWGINCGDDDAMQTLVNLILYRSAHDPADRRWEEAYDRHLRSEQRWSPNQQVAIDHQPAIRRPDVRRWPWERS
ncbi:transporter substrate-binding domain-containing protein [Dactylosporangium roseum]|uniref:Transporter substrate-binding domain-containing protein n=1 Tax=Dactylosporangium roseum TaxID=47989 RepID=A0ABY5Z7P5_9ACTN|nr:transporter substrate-binding domain-containing protein [Dactylosporangium roseum]UWZ38095.1 transporter substrate-binding domain-containing protein [Dactylosporangium roseum]